MNKRERNTLLETLQLTAACGKSGHASFTYGESSSKALDGKT